MLHANISLTYLTVISLNKVANLCTPISMWIWIRTICLKRKLTVKFIAFDQGLHFYFRPWKTDLNCITFWWLIKNGDRNWIAFMQFTLYNFLGCYLLMKILFCLSSSLHSFPSYHRSSLPNFRQIYRFRRFLSLCIETSKKDVMCIII